MLMLPVINIKIFFSANPQVHILDKFDNVKYVIASLLKSCHSINSTLNSTVKKHSNPLKTFGK